jgi:hypothetical protein
VAFVSEANTGDRSGMPNWDAHIRNDLRVGGFKTEKAEFDASVLE